MAYKFQVGPAQLSGALTQEGTIQVHDQSGVLQGHITDAGEISASLDLKAGQDLDVARNADIDGTLDVAGAVALAAGGTNTTVRGPFIGLQDADFRADLNVSGNTVLGNLASDTVQFIADVDSHILPSAGITYDLGASGDEWRRLYAGAVSATELSGGLEYALDQVTGGGLGEFRFDNTANVSIEVSGAAQLTDATITMWHDGDGKFVDSLLSENASNIEQASGDFKVMSGDVSASANLEAGGALDVAGNADIDGTLDVAQAVSLAASGISTTARGTFFVNEKATLRGDVQLGDAITDVVEFQADISSSMIPSDNSAFDIGSSSDRWANIYADNIDAAGAVDASELSGALEFAIDQLVGGGLNVFRYDNTADVTVEVSGAAQLTDATITMWHDGDGKFVDSLLSENASNIEQSSGDFKVMAGDLSASANLEAGGNLDLQGNADIEGTMDVAGAVNFQSTLSVTGAANFIGDVYLGDADTDNVIFSAEVSSSIIPDVDSSFDLGSNTKRWSTIYVDSIIGADLDLDVVTGTSYPAGTDVLLANGNATLLDIAKTGQSIKVKNISGGSITVDCDGSDTFFDNGGTQIELETDGAAVTLISSGSSWYII